MINLLNNINGTISKNIKSSNISRNEIKFKILNGQWLLTNTLEMFNQDFSKVVKSEKLTFSFPGLNINNKIFKEYKISYEKQ